MCHHLKTCAELFEHPRVSTVFLAAPANWFSYVVDKGYCVVQCQSCVSQDDTPREGIHSEGRSNQDATWRRSKKRQMFITIHFQFRNRFISPTALHSFTSMFFFGTSLPMHFTKMFPEPHGLPIFFTAFQRVVLWVLCVWHILWGWPRKFWGRSWPQVVASCFSKINWNIHKYEKWCGILMNILEWFQMSLWMRLKCSICDRNQDLFNSIFSWWTCFSMLAIT